MPNPKTAKNVPANSNCHLKVYYTCTYIMCVQYDIHCTCMYILQSTADEYEEMPIAEFGKAMLKGMGWTEGKPIGKTNQGLEHHSLCQCVCGGLYRAREFEL